MDEELSEGLVVRRETWECGREGGGMELRWEWAGKAVVSWCRAPGDLKELKEMDSTWYVKLRPTFRPCLLIQDAIIHCKATHVARAS